MLAPLEGWRPLLQGILGPPMGLFPVADLGFSPGGAPTPKSAIIFQFCPRKLHENERIWAPRGGARPWRPPLDPPMISHHHLLF